MSTSSLPSFIKIHLAVLEKKSKMWKVYGRTDDGRCAMTIAHSSLRLRWAKNTSLSVAEVVHYLNDPEETVSTIPFRPKGGSLYIFRPKSSKQNSWLESWWSFISSIYSVIQLNLRNAERAYYFVNKFILSLIIKYNISIKYCRWSNQGNRKPLPRSNPKYLKSYFHLKKSNGQTDKEFKKEVYFPVTDEPICIVHYVGNEQLSIPEWRLAPFRRNVPFT